MGTNTFRVLVPPEILKSDVECFVLNRFGGNERVEIDAHADNKIIASVMFVFMISPIY